MHPHPAARVRSARTLATIAFGAALLSACSNAAPSPSAATAKSPVPPSVVATPAGSVGPAALRVAPAAPCGPTGTGTDCIAPGRYALDASIAPAGITIDVPSGWFEWDPGGGSEGLLVGGGADAPDGSGWGVLFIPVAKVSDDPCAGNQRFRSTSSVDDVVQAIATWSGFQVTTPKSITIGNVPGKLVELRYTKDPATCPAAQLWTTPTGTPIDAYPMVANPGRPAQLRILDVHGQVIVIRSTDYPEPSPFEIEQGVAPDPHRHDQDQTALRSIVGSIQIIP